MSSSSSLGNRDVISTTTDSAVSQQQQQRYQYNAAAYPAARQSTDTTSPTDSSVVPLSSNVRPGRSGGDAIGNRVPSSSSSIRAGTVGLNPEINDLMTSSSGLSVSGGGGGGPSSSGPTPPVTTSKRWLVSSGMSRRLREFIPDFRKDQEYWQKRQKNNEAAKRSREKRRINDVVMGKRIYELSSENKRLRMELEAIKRHFGYPLNLPYPIDAVTLAASNNAPDRPESPMMFATMSSADSDEDDSESSQSRQVVVSGGVEYHRQPSSQDGSTSALPSSSSLQLADQHLSLSDNAGGGEGSYLRMSNNTSAGGRGGPDQYRQPHHRPQHYLTPVKNSDAHLLPASDGRHPPTQDSFSRFVPQSSSLDSVATPPMQKMTSSSSSTTSKSSAALARAEVLERLAISRAKQSAEQQQRMESYERGASRRYEDRGEGYEYRGQYYDRRSPPFFRSGRSDVDSRSDERGLMHDDASVQGCTVVGNNRNNGAFISRDLNDESSSWQQLKHQPAHPPLPRRIKLETSAPPSRWTDGDLGFSDVSSDADDARGVQFSVAEQRRSRPLEHRSESSARSSREAPLNLTKRLRMSALSHHGSSAGVEESVRFSTTHDNDDAEMPPLLMRTNRVMLSRSTSGDVKMMVPNVHSPTSSSPTCSSAPVPEFFLRSPPTHPQLQQRRSDSPTQHYRTSTSESSSQWIHSQRSGGQNLCPSSADFAPLSLPNIGTLTSGSRALRYIPDEIPPHVVMSTEDYSSEYPSDAVNTSARRRLQVEEEDGSSKSMEVINRHVRGGVPLKVWHKRSSVQPPDEWLPSLEDARYDSLSPRLERHGSTSELFHSSHHGSEASSLASEMKYKPESPPRRTDSDRNCTSRTVSAGEARVGDNELSLFGVGAGGGGGGGGYRGERRERVSLQAAVHLSTVALDELEGHHTGKQQQQQQQNQEATNFEAVPSFD